MLCPPPVLSILQQSSQWAGPVLLLVSMLVHSTCMHKQGALPGLSQMHAYYCHTVHDRQAHLANGLRGLLRHISASAVSCPGRLYCPALYAGCVCRTCCCAAVQCSVRCVRQLRLLRSAATGAHAGHAAQGFSMLSPDSSCAHLQPSGLAHGCAARLLTAL